MKVTFLGTGTSTGIPLIGCNCEVCKSKDPKDNRTRTSIFVENEGLKLVVDTGPDFRQQMLRENIDDIDAVLYTHSHKDHIAGLDDIRPINHLKKKTVDVYANQETIQRLKKEYTYIFDNDYPGVPQIKIHKIVNSKLTINELNIEVIAGMHGKMEVLGFKIKGLAYLTDMNFISKDQLEKIKGINTLVISAIQFKKHYSHFNIEEALAVVEEVNPKQAFFIHMSHKLGKHVDVEKMLPANVSLSYDGLKLEL